jgi:hypothetical protein
MAMADETFVGCPRCTGWWGVRAARAGGNPARSSSRTTLPSPPSDGRNANAGAREWRRASPSTSATELDA